jgi:hypothetical protein
VLTLVAVASESVSKIAPPAKVIAPLTIAACAPEVTNAAARTANVNFSNFIFGFPFVLVG